jgi:hypothetical protein
MTKNEDLIKDWRSTGRRKARRELFNNYVEFKCVGCGRTSKEPPKDAPKHFDEIWPEANRTLDYSLQANHKTKNYRDNDVSLLEWLCQPCHKERDSSTGKGESTVNMVEHVLGFDPAEWT